MPPGGGIINKFRMLLPHNCDIVICRFLAKARECDQDCYGYIDAIIFHWILLAMKHCCFKASRWAPGHSGPPCVIECATHKSICNAASAAVAANAGKSFRRLVKIAAGSDNRQTQEMAGECRARTSIEIRLSSLVLVSSFRWRGGAPAGTASCRNAMHARNC